MRIEKFNNHQLILDDSYNIIQSLTYDSIITDPPYKMDMTGGGLGSKRKYVSDIVDNKTNSGFNDNIFDNCNNWVSFCSKSQLVTLINKAESMSLRWMLLTWNKTNPTPLCNNNYLPDTEYIIHAFDKLDNVGYHNRRRYKVSPIEKNNFDHPSVKPIPICDWIIKTTTFENTIVLDPFMGTGSIGISAGFNHNRTFIGIEQNEKYFDIACSRFESMMSSNLDELFI